MIKVLMIEDDLELAEILTEYLAQFHIEVETFEDPFLGISAVSANEYDLIILDLTLPNMDGLEVCREITQKSDLPIIISSARSDLSDKVTGLSLGADDYLPKPYDPKELYARIMSIMRRYRKAQKPAEETANVKTDFHLDEDRHEIKLNGQMLNLTPAEYEILAFMIKKHGYALSREDIINNIESVHYDSGTKSIDVIIGRIRHKIGDSSKSPNYIHSVRGVGYKLLG